MEVNLVLAFAFPPVTVVGVVCRNDHEALPVIQPGAQVHVFGTLTPIRRYASLRIGRVVIAFPEVNRGGLQIVQGALEIEDAVKQGVVRGQLNPTAFGQDAFHLRLEIFPIPRSPEVIRHEHAAVEKILAEGADFLVAQFHAPGLRGEDEGIVEEGRVGQLQHPAVGVHFQGSQLLKAIGQIQVTVRIVVDPAYHAGAPGRFEYDAGEGEHVLLESGRIGPVWCARDLWSRLPGGAHGVFVHPLTAFSPYYRTGIATPETTTATRAKLSDTNTDRERRRGGRQEDFARC